MLDKYKNYWYDYSLLAVYKILLCYVLYTLSMLLLGAILFFLVTTFHTTPENLNLFVRVTKKLKTLETNFEVVKANALV